MDKLCCDKLKEAVESSLIDIMRETGKFSIVGCCGSCYVLTGLEYCPYCGAKGKAKG